MPRQLMVGKWRLVEMEQWDPDYIGLVQPGFISFSNGGHGEMAFGAASLNLDWDANGYDSVAFSFDGFDEMDEVSGRGWAKTVAERLVGAIRFHRGEKSGFVAERWKLNRKLNRNTTDRP